MLATNKININNYLSSQLPFEICNIIEDYTEITITIICEELRQFIIKVKIINVFNKNILGEIYLDDVFSEAIKENVHEWRKRVKDLWYSIRILSNLSP
jgi:uncharacterized protein (UPF0335 family)